MLTASADATGGTGVKRRALFLVFSDGLDGEIVLLPGSLGLAARGLDELRHGAAHFCKLLGEGPIPTGLCNKLRQMLARRAIQGRDPLDPA